VLHVVTLLRLAQASSCPLNFNPSEIEKEGCIDVGRLGLAFIASYKIFEISEAIVSTLLVTRLKEVSSTVLTSMVATSWKYVP
jgi:hypothetical protein